MSENYKYTFPLTSSLQHFYVFWISTIIGEQMLYMLYSMYVQGVKNRSLGTRLYNPSNTHLFNPPSIPSDSSPPPVTSPFVPISISCICLFDQIRIRIRINEQSSKKNIIQISNNQTQSTVICWSIGTTLRSCNSFILLILLQPLVLYTVRNAIL